MCMARALLRRSKILLLDEATASVDTVTDGRIQRTIRNDAQFASATRIIIAHRLQTIIDADRVLVMDAGTAAEFDKASVLLADPGSRLYGMAKALDSVEQLKENAALARIPAQVVI